MNTTFSAAVAILALSAVFPATVAHAGTRSSANYAIPADGMDDGGGRTSSAAYSVDASTGGFAGVPSNGPVGESLRSGFIGQLYEVIGYGIATETATVMAGNSLRLGAHYLLGDGTFLPVTGPLAFQWYRDGELLTGATDDDYVLTSVQAFQSGEYSVRITQNDGSTIAVDPVVFAITAPAPSNARLLNLSTRAQALTGDDVLIPGFVVSGTGSKRLLIRAVGPTLGTLGVNGTLVDPRMDVIDSAGATIATNDDWGSNGNEAAVMSTAATVGAFELVEGSKDAALLLDLPSGAYTVPTSGIAGGTGIAIVELYDADAAGATAELVNISNRGFAGVGDQVMIPGFVISPEGPKTLLIRVVGPTLAALGVAGAMTNPQLAVLSGSAPLFANDDWGDNPDAANTAATADLLGAFPLAVGSKDAALVVTLQPGAYTVIGSSNDGTGTGVVLVEVYVVP